jgi:hypothetical protein
MNKLKDSDIREALRRREARRTKPEVPADFMANVMQEIVPKPARKPRYAYIAALAAAACIVFAVLIVWPTEDKQKSDGSTLLVRQERTTSPKSSDCESEAVGLKASTKETINNVDSESRVLPAKVAVHQAKRTDRELVEQRTTASASDSLDYYINKIERELAQVDDSLYIERIHRVMHADERLQRIVNNYILNELHRDGKSSEASNINNVKTNEDEE